MLIITQIQDVQQLNSINNMKKQIIFSIVLLIQINIYAQWKLLPLPESIAPGPNAIFDGVGLNILNSDTFLAQDSWRNPYSSSIYFTFNRGNSWNHLSSSVNSDSGPGIFPTLKINNSYISRTRHQINIVNGSIELDSIVNSNVLTQLKLDFYGPGYNLWHRMNFDSTLYYFDDFSEPILYKSNDLGITSKIILDSINGRYQIGDFPFHAFDKNHLWALRRYPIGQGTNSFKSNFGKLYRSTDGGNTWQWVTTNLDTITSSFNPEYMYFIDKDTGFLSVATNLNIRVLYKTVNAGTTWTLVGNLPNLNTNIYFINSNIGFTFHRDVYKTSDGGITWIQQNSLPSSGLTYNSMQTFNKENFIIIRNGKNVYYTTTLGDPAVGLFESKKSIIDITVYPNPIEDGVFTIDWEEKQVGVDVKINIVDVLGREVPYLLLNNKTETTKANLTLQLNTSPGLYFIQMQQGAYTGSKSIVVQ